MVVALRPDSAQRAWRLVLALVALALLGVWAARVVAFFAVVPGTDFLGDILWTEFFFDHLAHGGGIPDWTHLDALGHPTTAQMASVLLFLPVVVLKALVGDTLVAAKVWYVTLHTSSAATQYALARKWGLARLSAGCAGLAYLLAPMHLREFSEAGHWQLAVSFALSPLVVALAIELTRAPGPRRLALFVLALTALLLSDNERTCTLLPVVAALVVADAVARGVRGGALVWGLAPLAGGLLLVALLSAPFALPLLLERGWLNLGRASPDFPLFPVHESTSLFHPFFVLDKADWLYAFAGPRPFAGGGVRAGWLWLGGAFLAVHFARREQRVEGLGWVVLFVIWLAGGSRSWATATLDLFPGRAWIGGALLGVLLVLGVTAIVRRGTDARRLAVRVPLAWCLVLVPARTLLGRVPPYEAIHNTLWFLTVNLPLVTALLLGTGAACWARAALRHRVLVGGGLVVLLGLDALTWPTNQTRAARGIMANVERVGEALGRDPEEGRYLPYPYLEADAREAFALARARRPSASSWLLWCAPRWDVAGIASLYRALRDAETLDAAADAAMARLAAANVRYIILRGGGRRLARLEERGLLVETASIGDDRLLRVAGHVDRTVRRVTSGSEEAVAYVRDSDTAFEIPNAAPGAYVIAEAWYPYWHVSTASGEVDAHPTAEGLIGFVVPEGAARAQQASTRVEYRRPAFYRLLWLAPALALAVMLALVLRARQKG